MKPTTHSERARAWTVDYSAARARAIRWLGDRYLLAKPINAAALARRPAPESGQPSTAAGPAAA
jgi:hypothetical protein